MVSGGRAYPTKAGENEEEQAATGKEKKEGQPQEGVEVLHFLIVSGRHQENTVKRVMRP
jgi:hypothetical protein